MQDPYCYKGTEVLKNKKHIRDAEELQNFERRASSARLIELKKKGITGGFDLGHLLSLHKYIFGGVYPWAGKTRTVDIAKDLEGMSTWNERIYAADIANGRVFCPVQNVQPFLEQICKDLKKDSFLTKVSFEDMPGQMAKYFGDLNAAHPFRTGNGRVQREFFRQLAEYNDCTLDLDLCPKEVMVLASHESSLGDNERLEAVFRACLTTPDSGQNCAIELEY